MKDWHYGINSYKKTGHIHIQTGSWYYFALDYVTETICGYIPAIPLPKIPFKLRDKLSIEINDNKKWTNLNDWYGDISSLFCCLVHNYVLHFCDKHMNHKTIEVEYNKLKELFYEEDKEIWDREEEIDEELRKEDAET